MHFFVYSPFCKQWWDLLTSHRGLLCLWGFVGDLYNLDIGLTLYLASGCP